MNQTSTKSQPTAEQMEALKGLAASIVYTMRVPTLRTPAEYGMEFQELTIPSYDGVPLKAWYIPAKNSNKLIICNHPKPMNRYGYPGHLGEPYTVWADFEVNFLPEYKVMHDAGYNVLTYDLRNHGESGEGDGGVCGIGRHEWKDCVGVKRFVDSHPEMSKMTKGLMSRCTGANAQYEAISRYPELFADIKAMVSPQPLSMSYFINVILPAQGLGEFKEELDREQNRLGGFTNGEMSAQLFAPAVNIPTLVSQVHDDSFTNPADVQTIYDLLGTQEKELVWVHGTTRRFDGYNYFGENPDKMLAWYAKYMGE
jgi:hypothetical protein